MVIAVTHVVDLVTSAPADRTVFSIAVLALASVARQDLAAAVRPVARQALAASGAFPAGH
jgi:hypothetical protein